MTIYTKEMMEDLLQCSTDPEHFIYSFLGWDVFNRDVSDWEDNVTQDPTITRHEIAAYALWYMIFHPSHTVFIVSKSQADRAEMSKFVQDFYNDIPEWMQPKVSKKLVSCLELENGAQIVFEIASPYTGKGWTISMLILDQYDEYKPSVKEALFEGLWPVVVATTSTSIIVGTEPRLDV
jgi:hypothetical protein